MAAPKKLGSLLKEAGLLDDMQLEAALAHQRQWGGKLGTILIEMRMVREEDVARTIATKLKLRHEDLFHPEIPEEIISLLKPEVARQYGVVPLRRDARTLYVAMADPLDLNAVDAVRFITGLTVRPCLALESEIADAIRKYYDHENVFRAPRMRSAEGAGPAGQTGGLPAPARRAAAPDRGAALPAASEREAAVAAESAESMGGLVLRLDALLRMLADKGVITPQDREALLRIGREAGD